MISLSGSRNSILPLQDKANCQDYARLYKQQNREKEIQEQANLKAQCDTIKNRIQGIIKTALEESKESEQNSFVLRFIDILGKNRDSLNKNRNIRFLDYFGYLLESTNEEEMFKLRDEYSGLTA